MESKPNLELSYVIRYVSDMDAAVAFHRYILGLDLEFTSPFWSEFGAAGMRLGLHPASEDWPSGSLQLGFRCNDLADLYERRVEFGVTFTGRPRRQHGVLIGTILDEDGNTCRVAQQSAIGSR